MIVGAGRLARQVAVGVRAQSAAGLSLVGCVDNEVNMLHPDDPLGLGGRQHGMPAWWCAEEVDEVIFALPLRAHGIIEWWARARHYPRVRVGPHYLDMAMSRATVEEFNGLPWWVCAILRSTGSTV